METKTLKFGSLTLTFLKFDGHWVVPATMVGRALGYSKNGTKLIEVLKNMKAVFNEKLHFLYVDGERLKEFKEVAGIQSDVAPTKFLFTISGLRRFLMYSRKPDAKEFRETLDNFSFDEVSKEVDQNLAKIGSKQMELPLGNFTIDAERAERLADKLKDSGSITGEQWAGILKGILEAVLTGSAVNFDLKNLRGGPEQKLLGYKPLPQTFKPGQHPAILEGWKTAEDIGKELNLTADQVKTVIRKLAEEKEPTELLANNVARKLVKDLGDIRNVPVAEDGHLYVKNSFGTCVAVYAETEDGLAVWRNFWSPEMAAGIRERAKVKYNLGNVVLEGVVIEKAEAKKIEVSVENGALLEAAQNAVELNKPIA